MAEQISNKKDLPPAFLWSFPSKLNSKRNSGKRGIVAAFSDWALAISGWCKQWELKWKGSIKALRRSDIICHSRLEMIHDASLPASLLPHHLLLRLAEIYRQLNMAPHHSLSNKANTGNKESAHLNSHNFSILFGTAFYNIYVKEQKHTF